jgi:sulfur carrier protein
LPQFSCRRILLPRIVSLEAKNMQITLNGQRTETAGRILPDLIAELGLDPYSVVAEVNSEFIRRDLWQQYLLHDGDKIELLSFVGGG